MNRSLAVNIAGQRYTLKSDAEESYVRELASLVDAKIRDVEASAKIAHPQAVAVLAALQLADELTRERQRRCELRQKVRERSAAIRQLLEEQVKR